MGLEPIAVPEKGPGIAVFEAVGAARSGRAPTAAGTTAVGTRTAGQVRTEHSKVTISNVPTQVSTWGTLGANTKYCSRYILVKAIW